MADTVYDIAVVGSGIAGLTAAGAAAKAGRTVLNICDSELWGGLVANVGALAGYPSDAAMAEPRPAEFPHAAEAMSGLDLALALSGANADRGVVWVTQPVLAVARSARGFVLTGAEDTFAARAVIAATGARLKMLDVPGARALVDKGVSQCAWCDGGLYRDADVVVVGGGDAAVEEALHLATLARSVTLLARGAQLEARGGYVQRAEQAARLRVRTGTIVEAVLGTDGVEGVRVRETSSGHSEDLACKGVFVFIGLEPASGYLGGLVERDATGAIITDAGYATKTPGLFAVGAVRGGYRGRLVHAIAEAEVAAQAAAAFAG